MKATINSRELLGLLSAASKALPGKSPVQVLNNFLFAFGSDRIEVSAFDGETSASASASCQCESEGSACLPAKFVLDLCKLVPDSPVEISLEPGQATIKTPTGTFKTPILEASEYPSLPTPDEGSARVEADAPQLLAALSKVSFAIGEDTYHPQLMAVSLRIDGGSFRACATDSRVLALSEGTGCLPEDASVDALLPPKAAQCAQALFAKAEKIEIMCGQGRIAMRAEGREMSSPLAKGRFPEYMRLFPSERACSVKAPRQGLLNAVRRAALCADSDVSAIVMECSALSGCSIKCRGVGTGREAVEIPEAEVEGQAKTAFSPAFLSKALSALEGPSVEISVKSASAPALITEPETAGLRILLMPMAMPAGE